MNLSTKQTRRHKEETGGCSQGEKLDWKFETSRYKLLNRLWINNRVLLYSTENYIQPNGIKNNGKKYFKKCIYV